ncbi:hypothetical protein [Pseudomonas sp. G166]|uniref:hypothetical protein n=1 Tax=Pseudomonas sp. G166 TaxID=3094846 RepID=UPI00300BCD84
MNRVIAAALVGLSVGSLKCLANDSVPHEHWGFMPGYRYDYAGCRVDWNERRGEFITSGDQCDRISPQKMTTDAVKSIEYVKKNSSASDFLEYYALVHRAESQYTQQEANKDAQKSGSQAVLTSRMG